MVPVLRLLPALPLLALAVLAAAPTAQAAPVPTPAPAPTAAALDPAAIARAQADVDALGTQVARATADLTAGTQRLEQAQARLADTQAQADAARTAAQAALARAAAARALLARVVNAAYRSPRPDDVALALSTSPGELEQVLLANAALDQVQGNQDQALRVATEQGDQAQALSARADGLQQQAQAEQQDLAGQAAALQAQAAGIRAQLDAAAARLAAVQGMVLPGDASGGGALCTGAPTLGYPNGYLPAESLCPLNTGPPADQRLRADAAAAFNRMTAAHPLCVTDSYRSYGEQVDVYARKPGLAAVPGTSNHGLGLAVDLCGGVETFGTPAYQWMKQNAQTFGFAHPAWAEPGGSRPEPWHWEYVGGGSAPDSPSQ